MDVAKAYGQAVPGIDRGDQKGQGGDLLFGEMRSESLVICIRRSAISNSCHGFGPGKSPALARTVERRIAPGAQDVETLLAFAVAPRLARMHMQTIGASIDLGGPDLDQVPQARLQPAFARSEERRVGRERA